MMQVFSRIIWSIFYLLFAVIQIFMAGCARRIPSGQPHPDIDRCIEDREVVIGKDRASENAARSGRTAEREPYPEHIYPAPYFNNIENSSEKRQLSSFLEEGFGRRLDNNGAGPRDIINTAYEYLGVRHCMGGRTKRCLDCSGLLVAVFDEHGIHLPHNSEEQARFGRILSAREQLREGDLVFFVRSYRTSRFITHSGIYVGDNRFIHTSSSRGVVVTHMNNPFWLNRFVFATRIFD